MNKGKFQWGSKPIIIKDNSNVYCLHPTCDLPCKHMDNKQEGYKEIKVTPFLVTKSSGETYWRCDNFLAL